MSGSALPRAGGAARSGAAAPDTPRRAPPGRPESRSRRRLPGKFPVPFRSFLSNTFCSSSLLRSLLRLPSPLRAPPQRSPQPGQSWCVQSPSVPSGEFLDQVVVPIGRRGGEEPGDERAEANQAAAARGGAGPGRGDRGRGRGPASREAVARADRTRGGAGGAAGSPNRAAVAGEPPWRLGVRQFPPGKAKDGGAETQSLVLKGAGRIEN